MEIDNELKQLEERMQELKRQQEEQEKAKRADALGYYAKRTCESELQTVLTMVEYIDFDKLTPERLYGAFQQINKASYTAMRAIERDVAEKD